MRCYCIGQGALPVLVLVCVGWFVHCMNKCEAVDEECEVTGSKQLHSLK